MDCLWCLVDDWITETWEGRRDLVDKQIDVIPIHITRPSRDITLCDKMYSPADVDARVTLWAGDLASVHVDRGCEVQLRINQVPRKHTSVKPMRQ